ncbi:DUF937 domain-containing protein [Nocardioides jejuensis]|uniref:DUF937 domain-containing protein n=1 Tax=Nocardioides jejuensis TaxID=2502782 RepID=A0A4R1CFJ4_9ACTN|nr:DUF937 domain-containing protein [Nocardioides jejuensis]TCJ30084.1 DUF937 domain-containing protein [Nocardioides jejuensis]
MSDLDALLASLPIDSLAAQTGESPDAVRQAAGVALPALLGGLHANAEGGGLGSLLEALSQHEGGDGTQVDAAEGAQIASHIFGANQEQVINQLGSTGVPSGLLQKLIPLLAPIVMAWIAKQMAGKGAAPSSGGSGDVLGQVLGQVLGGATGGSGGGLAGSILSNVLGGLLGGGRK